MRSGRADDVQRGDILRSVHRIEEVLQEGAEAFARSWRSQSAVVRELEVIGEAAGPMSAGVRRRHPEIPWVSMRGFRSFAKHEDWRADPARLWQAVEEVPSLRDPRSRVHASSPG